MTILLIVDDEELILHVVGDGLEESGFTTVHAHDGPEAIAVLRSSKSKISGLITDVNLGKGVRGWDVARAAREESPDMPVVYMTGDSAQEWASQGVPNSAIVQKPFAISQIITAISQLLNDATARGAVST